MLDTSSSCLLSLDTDQHMSRMESRMSKIDEDVKEVKREVVEMKAMMKLLVTKSEESGGDKKCSCRISSM